MDLNYRLVCSDCKKMPPNIVEDYKAGDLICGDCGLVFPMRIIDTRSEWRNFSNDTGAATDDPSRVGAAENPLLDGVVDQLSTGISKKDGTNPTSQLLSKAQGKVTGGVKGDRDLLQVGSLYVGGGIDPLFSVLSLISISVLVGPWCLMRSMGLCRRYDCSNATQCHDCSLLRYFCDTISLRNVLYNPALNATTMHCYHTTPPFRPPRHSRKSPS